MNEIPLQQVSETPIYLMATAGMRLLAKDEQEGILAAICDFVKTRTAFHMTDCHSHIQIIPGEAEGLYGWIAANYLLGSFDHLGTKVVSQVRPTIGFLDMGGASAQIAFAPNETESVKHLNDLKLVRLRKLNGHDMEYNVFATSWLGFGANQARTRYIDALVTTMDTQGSLSTAISELQDPCLPRGLRTLLNGDPVFGVAPSTPDTIVTGTGEFEECLSAVQPLLGKNQPCEDEPCLFDGKHVPAIDFGVNHFIGVSEFWHTTQGVFGHDYVYDLASFQTRVATFCTREWTDIQADVLLPGSSPDQTARNVQEACFKAAWFINILYEGIGIPAMEAENIMSTGNLSQFPLGDSDDAGVVSLFKPIDKIDGVSLSWTLGKMVIHASANVPSKVSGLPIGYSNNDGSFSDFEEPSPFSELAYGNRPGARSVIGWVLLVVLLLLALIGVFLRNCDRQLHPLTSLRSCNRRFRRWLLGWTRRPDGSVPLIHTIFSRSKPAEYDLIAEQGVIDSLDLGEFELDYMERGRPDGPDNCQITPTQHALRGGGVGRYASRLAPVASSSITMDRSGMAIRTDSREWLPANIQMLHAGRRSGAGSPARTTN
jgi:Golgi apyrase